MIDCHKNDTNNFETSSVLNNRLLSVTSQLDQGVITATQLINLYITENYMNNAIRF